VTLGARDIEKRFGHRPILRKVNLDLTPGEVVLLRGANGSGKTTFARILSTTLASDRGTVTLDGRSVRANLRAARRAIGFASHRPLLYLGLTPVENLDFFGQLSGVSDAKVRARRLLGRFDLEEFADTPVDRFSRGMLQRVSLIRALLPEPRVLILDEPYAGLDAEGTATLNDVLEEARDRGAAALVISHDVDRIAPLVTRECALRGGVIEDGALDGHAAGPLGAGRERAEGRGSGGRT
jgi:ABC-type multidrug transport system ATPase subunit